MNRSRAAITGVLISILAILALGYLLPPQMSFNVRNMDWNGHSQLESTYDLNELGSLGNLEAKTPKSGDSTLLLLGPTLHFSRTEVEEVQDFVEEGGRLILADDFGSGNALLEGMEMDLRFAEVPLRDPVFKIKDSRLPKIFEFSDSPVVEDLSAIAFNSGTVLTDPNSEGSVLAESSESSYVGENRLGPFPVIYEVDRGNGQIFLLSDSSLFINTMIRKENNRELLESLIDGRTVYLDTSHWEKSTFVKFQDHLFAGLDFLDRMELRYGLLFLLTVLVFMIGWGKKEKEDGSKKREVEEVLKKHPQWDEETLKRLQKERSS